MKIQTFSVVIGTPACDAGCPFCISHITGFEQLDPTPTINLRNFDKACSLATMGGCTTNLFTGKGEPTLYPDELTTYLSRLQQLGSPFPFIELQTNGIQIGHLACLTETGRAQLQIAMNAAPGCAIKREDFVPKYQRLSEDHLKHWYNLGLNTIALSVVGTNPEHNRSIYTDKYPPLERTIAYLHELGYTVRLCVMMHKGMVDSVDGILAVADWCRMHKVAQLTVRPIRAPELYSKSGPTSEELYIAGNGIPQESEIGIRDEIDRRARLQGLTHILTLMHGAHAAKVYDFDGQNLCISDCLTLHPQSDDIRTLIFYSDGKLIYAWQHEGARLL